MCKLPRKAYRGYFPNYMGLLQGEVLSPILFPMYINNIEFNFIKENCSCVDIQLNNIFLLMYAEWYGFNSRIATKFTKKVRYFVCNEWKLEVNVQKTKIVAFRNGGKSRITENWSYNGYHIDIVSEFNYLGVWMSSILNFFFKTQKHVADQGRKVLELCIRLEKFLQEATRLRNEQLSII